MRDRGIILWRFLVHGILKLLFASHFAKYFILFIYSIYLFCVLELTFLRLFKTNKKNIVRPGTLPLVTEVDRYKGIAEEHCLCFCDLSVVENVFHLVFHCPMYNDL